MRLLFCVLVFCLFCFVFFCFILVWYFLLRLKVLVCFSLCFFWVKKCLFSSHVAKLSSFDPSKLISSIKDRCKEHLVDGGLSLPYKKESIWIRITKLGQVWRSPARWSFVNEPCWFIYRCLRCCKHSSRLVLVVVPN